MTTSYREYCRLDLARMGRARVLSTVRFAHGLRRRRSANLIACGDRRIFEEAVLDCVLAAVPEVMEVEGVGMRRK